MMQSEGPSHALDLPAADFRSGFVAVVGRPNVGKSTLVNRLLGQKIAIVSSKPQTTRNRLLGILTRSDAQVILLDTPGVHTPKHRLGEAMVATAASVLRDADAVLWIVDGSDEPAEEDRQVARLLGNLSASVPVILGLNKCDRMGLADARDVGRKSRARIEVYRFLAPQAEPLLISAERGDNLDRLMDLVVSKLPPGPMLYPEDQVTDQMERFMVGELIREQVLLKLRDEVPHSVAVAVQEFRQGEPKPGELKDEMTYISAVIYVERDSQKPILLGKDGQMLKRIGQDARIAVEELVGTRVFLDLWVKVRPRWRDTDEELRRLGHEPPRATVGRKATTRAKGGGHLR